MCLKLEPRLLLRDPQSWSSWSDHVLMSCYFDMLDECCLVLEAENEMLKKQLEKAEEQAVLVLRICSAQLALEPACSLKTLFPCHT